MVSDQTSVGRPATLGLFFSLPFLSSRPLEPIPNSPHLPDIPCLRASCSFSSFLLIRILFTIPQPRHLRRVNKPSPLRNTFHSSRALRHHDNPNILVIFTQCLRSRGMPPAIGIGPVRAIPILQNTHIPCPRWPWCPCKLPLSPSSPMMPFFPCPSTTSPTMSLIPCCHSGAG